VFSIGAGYRSPVKVENSGSATFSQIAQPLQTAFGGGQYKSPLLTTANFPAIVNLGLAYRPNKKLIIGLEIEWLGWSRFRNSKLDFQNEVPSAGFTDVSAPLNWNDTWLYKIGTEYRIDAHYTLRAGYAFIESRVPTETLSPSFPDTDSHSFTLGLGWQSGPFNLDAFYMVQFFEKITVSNDILNGSYDTFTHGLGLSIGYVF
jgi:long-chain fatty acid transport protein